MRVEADARIFLALPNFIFGGGNVGKDSKSLHLRGFMLTIKWDSITMSFHYCLSDLFILVLSSWTCAIVLYTIVITH